MNKSKNDNRRRLANAFRLDRLIVYLVLQHGMSDCRLVKALVYCAPISSQVIALHFALIARRPIVHQLNKRWCTHMMFEKGQLRSAYFYFSRKGDSGWLCVRASDCKSSFELENMAMWIWDWIAPQKHLIHVRPPD